MMLGRLNENGIASFSTYLIELRSEPTKSPPFWLLDDPASSEVAAQLEMKEHEFSNRLEAAQYLDELLCSSQLENIDRDVGLWSWLTLFHFEKLCPKTKAKARSVAALPSYIPEVNTQRRLYRHLLLGPWFMFRLHRDNPDRLRAMLCSPPDVATSEAYRLFVENPTLIFCRSVVEVASKLYFNPANGSLKRGSGRKNSGGCRRLTGFLNQLDCTYDLQSIAEESLMKMLPREFHEFLS